MEKVVCGRFKLLKKIGAGSFGQIYASQDLETAEIVAVKLEPLSTKVPQLCYESKLLEIFSGSPLVPRLLFFGKADQDFSIMAIELLGKSIEDLFTQCKYKFSVKTVLMLADQMISGVEFLHQKNFIHRDIKPDNFLMGTGKNSKQVYIIDFGLSKRFRDIKTHAHIPFSDKKSMTGTARYASINCLRGIEQSRRDDMESLGYVWMYLLRGSLPWMGLRARTRKQKYQKICEVKVITTIESLSHGFPAVFAEYFRLIRDLKFQDEPEYARYRAMFREEFMKDGYIYDGVYDWTEKSKAEPTMSDEGNESGPQKVENSPPPSQKVEIEEISPQKVESAHTSQKVESVCNSQKVEFSESPAQEERGSSHAGRGPAELPIRPRIKRTRTDDRFAPPEFGILKFGDGPKPFFTEYKAKPRPAQRANDTLAEECVAPSVVPSARRHTLPFPAQRPRTELRGAPRVPNDANPRPQKRSAIQRG